jgi:hypothetical protein
VPTIPASLLVQSQQLDDILTLESSAVPVQYRWATHGAVTHQLSRIPTVVTPQLDESLAFENPRPQIARGALSNPVRPNPQNLLIQCPVLEPLPENPLPTVTGGRAYQPRVPSPRVLQTSAGDLLPDPPANVSKGVYNPSRPRPVLTISPPALEQSPESALPTVLRAPPYIPWQPKPVTVVPPQNDAVTVSADPVPVVMWSIPRAVPIPQVQIAPVGELPQDLPIPSVLRTRPRTVPVPVPVVAWQEGPFLEDSRPVYQMRPTGFTPTPWRPIIQPVRSDLSDVWLLLIADGIGGGTGGAMVTSGGGPAGDGGGTVTPIPPVSTPPAIMRVKLTAPIVKRQVFPQTG